MYALSLNGPLPTLIGLFHAAVQLPKPAIGYVAQHCGLGKGLIAELFGPLGLVLEGPLRLKW